MCCFRKAFDSLDHVILLQRLSALGVHGTELLWFINYLSHRVQRVKFQDEVSSWCFVKGGILQGIVHWPIAVPYLCQYDAFQCKTWQADDTTLICSGNSCGEVQQQLNWDLQLLQSWIDSSRMKLNINKSGVMWFEPKQRVSSALHPPIVVDGHQLQEVEQQKYLGVLFDNKLQWSSHVNYISKTVSYQLLIFAQCSSEVPNI